MNGEHFNRSEAEDDALADAFYGQTAQAHGEGPESGEEMGQADGDLRLVPEPEAEVEGEDSGEGGNHYSSEAMDAARRIGH